MSKTVFEECLLGRTHENTHRRKALSLHFMLKTFPSKRNSNQPYESGNLTLPVNSSKGGKAPPPPPVRGATAVGIQPPRPATMSRLKQSDSSFGLHSPDNLPVGFSSGDTETVVILH